MSERSAQRWIWLLVLTAAIGPRLWNALHGARMWGFDAWGHVAYVLFIDLYRGVPWADQGWSYFHPPLHYTLGALLARAGSGEFLMRGLSLLGSAASLGSAVLAAVLARRIWPGQPLQAALAFGAIALLPVQFYLSPMPGNQSTANFMAAAALFGWIALESRERPGWGGAAGVGVLVGLALLAKFSGILLLGVVGGHALACALGRADPAPRRRARVARAALVGVVAIGLSGPYYLRNLREFGTPFQLSRDFDLVRSVEREQEPGVRSWRDYVSFPLRTFREPNPLAPHLLHSVWASAYLGVWFDAHRESDVERALSGLLAGGPALRAMLLAGIPPTLLLCIGAFAAGADLRRGRRVALWLPLFLQLALSLGSFVLFTWRVPIWSAVKASYLLDLSLPCALFLVRGFEAIARRGPPGLRAAVGIVLAGVGLAASAVAVDGLVLRRRADAPATGAVHFYFGEYDAARRIYGRLVQGARYPVPWLENLAAVELAAGRREEAVRLYERAVVLAREAGRPDRRREGRLALAQALAGGLEAARDRFTELLAGEEIPELRANRGAVEAALGDDAAALADLERAAAAIPEALPVLRNLERVQSRLGLEREAETTRARGDAIACRAPRGYPYGLGTGETLEWGVLRRGLLVVGDDGLRVALPFWYRGACR